MKLECLQIAKVASLGDFKRAGKELLFHCPVHNDTNPSLRINPKKNVWFCDPCAVGGDPWDLAAFIRGCDRSDKEHVTKWLREHGLLNGGRPDKEFVCAYVYEDENRTPLFRVERYRTTKPPFKTFRQSRPDENGGWVPGVKSVRLVPYRLPEFVKRKTVFIVEGEKDADALWKWGVPATTNPMGAGKWPPEFNQYFADKQVVILPDNDPPGEAHSRTVAQNLLPIAKAVKIVQLPDLPPKGDFSDWKQRGGTKERLRELLKATPELTAADMATWKETRAKAALQLVSVGTLLSEPAESVRWLWEGHLPAGGLSVIASKPKIGKSTLARCLALAVARGVPFLGRATQQGTVIYLALEEKRGELREHFRAMGATTDDPILIHVAHASDGAFLELRKLAEIHKPVLIIVDPLFKLVRVKDGNDYAQMTAALEPLLILARETGAHVMVVHHAGKGERSEATDTILGSTALYGGVDTALVMKRAERYRTVQSSQRYGIDLPETVLEFDPESRTLTLGAERAEAEKDRVAGGILEYLSGCLEPQSEPEIGVAVEGKTAWKRTSLRELVKVGKLERIGRGKSGDPFLYKVSFSCSPYISGTRKQDIQTGGYPIENTQECLVPDIPPDLHESRNSREQEKSAENSLPWELEMDSRGWPKSWNLADDDQKHGDSEQSPGEETQ